ncbi:MULTISPECIES: 6,7-dimethyl-8-ribityllumazine synthase [Salegentibacter]|jgi:6,7-dimethyl-8-ribityllumazine synthase|uniref:6,7-dimethyl-8-ribityllumazine synthase n=1 Tax=Salegentibacter agarivorans TaxID=345907 RepID=A0A1I2K0M4_9FLAO|nr:MULTISPECIES: 6,7-dimethyl-8-ribityllumazine synthase [Salegentibacter]APS39373.1 6,7-dimethyl-8-ribityllumazine synthase [Salegentibacter sp. T436]MBO2544866.1 6,7-dimethyl-8-ribityllumazine synthase [Salegentibacter sp. BDJ18]SFF60705.1 6,7-dimethyl-8-ribityllumazine synthase [Salegentibacter agarivorans]|tara:strand:+ start:1306 stop:1803 length:498 start_codon:yes stop_codon:yes gene_type:complete
MATEGNNLSDYDKDQLPDASDFRIGIVVSEWNDKITEGLYEGAFNALIENKVQEKRIVRWNVPGSFELIYGCKKMQESYDMLDAIIAIGSVIEGETKHFDFVCEGVTQGIKDLNVQNDTPIIFCVLTDQNMQQAIDRSGGKHGNKGTEAAIAAIKMAKLRQDARF